MAGGTRCERCGTMVENGRVICPNCDNVVDLSFLEDQPAAGGERGSPFSDSTVPMKAMTPTTASDEMPRFRSLALFETSVLEATAAPVPEPDTPTLRLGAAETPRPISALAGLGAPAEESLGFLEEHTSSDFNPEDLRSSTDALILGDAGNIVETLWIDTESTVGTRQAMVGAQAGRPLPQEIPQGVDFAPPVGPGPADNRDFLSAPTQDGLRDIIPLQVYVGADVARMIEKESVLQKTTRATSGLALSPFEQFVLDQIDGVRPVARIQKRMGLGDADLRIALALLADKKLVEQVGRAASTKPTDPGFRVPPMPSGSFRAPPPVPSGSFAVPPSPVSAPSPVPSGSFPAPSASVRGPSASFALPAPSARVPSASFPLPAPSARVPSASFPAPGAAAPVPAGSSPVPSRSFAKPTPASLPLPSIASAPRAPTAPLATPAAARPAVVDDAGHARALALHSQCLRDLKGGAVARAWGVAKMAHESAPDVALYREVLDDWNAFVSQHKVADDARLHAQAVSAETAGDVDRAVTLLKQATTANPRNAAAWNRLGLLLATRMNDLDGALNAMTRAIELSPDDPTFKNNFGKIAALSQRRGRPANAKSGLFGRLFRGG